MNIIEKVREIVQAFPRISELMDEVHIDFADPEPSSYGLSSTGDELLREDVLGNQTRQHSFMLYATYSSMNDYERLGNSSVLLELGQWLERQAGCDISIAVGEETYPGTLTKLSAANGMLIAVTQGDLYDGVQYQLQIIAEYTVEVY